ncbi:MAG: GPR endopeptidase [bacterium]|jgi:spore protease
MYQNKPFPGVRTDLALEAHQLLKQQVAREVSGITSEEAQIEGCQVTTVRVHSPEAGERLGKAPGTYVTIETPDLLNKNRLMQEKVSGVLAGELGKLLGLKPKDGVFVVGLGNWNATPDSLGPLVVDRMLITRHLAGYVPKELTNRLRSVCAVAPGVLGITGIETSEIVRGIAEKIKPAVVIAIDALAARSIGRIGTTIQLTDTGIHPGSGVGNKRTGITRETLGVPVIALGIPTVVHATTVANDTIDLLLNEFRQENRFLDVLRSMEAENKRALINEVLSPAVGDLMVTPKEIDLLLNEVSRIVASGINMALHPGVDMEDVSRYI